MNHLGELSCIDIINLCFRNLCLNLLPIYIGFLYLQISKYKYAKILGILILFMPFLETIIGIFFCEGCHYIVKNIMSVLSIVRVLISEIMIPIFLICFLLNLKKLLSKNCDIQQLS